MPDPSHPPAAAQILDAVALQRALRRIAHEIIERNPDLSRIVIVGIPSRGVNVATRIADAIEQLEGTRPEEGVIDISMHRDDLRRRHKLTTVLPTQLPLDLSGRTVILADDVIFTGRSIRAAMDAISSFGRPDRIQLAALVDRGHRELPIRPDYVGKNLPTAPDEHVLVRFEEADGEPDAVWLAKPEGSNE